MAKLIDEEVVGDTYTGDTAGNSVRRAGKARVVELKVAIEAEAVLGLGVPGGVVGTDGAEAFDEGVSSLASAG